MTRKQIGLIVVALALVGFGIYDFWDGYHSGHSVLRGVLSVLAGILFGFLCSGWPGKSHREAGPPVV